MAGRYDTLQPTSLPIAEGGSVEYLPLRVLPFGWTVAGVGTTVVRTTEQLRLDLIATRTIGNPLLSWQIADANDAMDPFSVCEVVGSSLQLPATNL